MFHPSAKARETRGALLALLLRSFSILLLCFVFVAAAAAVLVVSNFRLYFFLENPSQ